MHTVNILVRNDPSVGLPNERYEIQHLEFIDDEHREYSIAVLRQAFANITGASLKDVVIDVEPE
jgi:hypothetical protein